MKPPEDITRAITHKAASEIGLGDRRGSHAALSAAADAPHLFCRRAILLPNPPCAIHNQWIHLLEINDKSYAYHIYSILGGVLACLYWHNRYFFMIIPEHFGLLYPPTGSIRNRTRKLASRTSSRVCS